MEDTSPKDTRSQKEARSEKYTRIAIAALIGSGAGYTLINLLFHTDLGVILIAVGVCVAAWFYSQRNEGQTDSKAGNGEE